MSFKYCLFDLDGTLTDPAIGITNSVMHALEKYDIHVSDRSELYPFIGPPLDYSFKTFYGFSDEQAVEAIKYYREYFSVTGLFENKVYDGVPEMLEALQKKGVPVFEYTPLQVKSAVTGFGQAQKPQVMEMTKRLLRLKAVPKPDDTADALAMAICHGQATGSTLRRAMLQQTGK